jgi:hypothetical protein
MNPYKLSNNERVNRIGVGAVLIIFTMLTPAAPLGWLAILPLIATLPIFCGLFGYDPVSKFVSKELSHMAHAIIHHSTHKPHHN